MSNGKFNLPVDKNAALNSEPNVNWIKKSGVYFGTIKKAVIVESKDSNSWGVEIEFLTDDGEQANLKMYIANKNGGFTYMDAKTREEKLLPNYNLFQAIFCILNIKDILAVKGKESWGYTSLTNKKIGFGLQRREQENNYAGATKPFSWKTELVRVFDYTTRKSLHEIEKNTEAKAWLNAIEDKPLKENQNNSTNESAGNEPDGDLPF